MNDALNYLIDSHKIIINSIIDLFIEQGVNFQDILNAVDLNDEEKELLEEFYGMNEDE